MKYLVVLGLLIFSSVSSAEMSVRFKPTYNIGVGYAATREKSQSIFYGEGIFSTFLFQTYKKTPRHDDFPLDVNFLGVGLAASSKTADLIIAPVSVIWCRHLGFSYNYHVPRKVFGYGMFFQF